MRPWTLNEVPVGRLVRFRTGDQDWRGRIQSADETFLLHISNCPVVFTPAEALTMLEYLDNDFLTWKPCGAP
jgi:hypothetical protein